MSSELLIEAMCRTLASAKIGLMASAARAAPGADHAANLGFGHQGLGQLPRDVRLGLVIDDRKMDRVLLEKSAFGVDLVGRHLNGFDALVAPDRPAAGETQDDPKLVIFGSGCRQWRDGKPEHDGSNDPSDRDTLHGSCLRIEIHFVSWHGRVLPNRKNRNLPRLTRLAGHACLHLEYIVSRAARYAIIAQSRTRPIKRCPCQTLTLPRLHLQRIPGRVIGLSRGAGLARPDLVCGFPLVGPGVPDLEAEGELLGRERIDMPGGPPR